MAMTLPFWRAAMQIRVQTVDVRLGACIKRDTDRQLDRQTDRQTAGQTDR